MAACTHTVPSSIGYTAVANLHNNWSMCTRAPLTGEHMPFGFGYVHVFSRDSGGVLLKSHAERLLYLVMELKKNYPYLPLLNK
jgi:hypothetical protein